MSFWGGRLVFSLLAKSPLMYLSIVVEFPHVSPFLGKEIWGTFPVQTLNMPVDEGKTVTFIFGLN